MDLRTNRQDGFRESNRIEQTAAEQRRRNEQMARQFSDQAMQQWQRSIEGFLALPTATALSVASGTMYAAAIVERSFETVQRIAEALRRAGEEAGRQMERQMQESTRTEGRGMEGERPEEGEWSPGTRHEARA